MRLPVADANRFRLLAARQRLTGDEALVHLWVTPASERMAASRGRLRRSKATSFCRGTVRFSRQVPSRSAETQVWAKPRRGENGTLAFSDCRFERERRNVSRSRLSMGTKPVGSPPTTSR